MENNSTTTAYSQPKSKRGITCTTFAYKLENDILAVMMLKTAVWLYLFIFVAFFDLHAQYPILTPFAVSLGAAPSFIGLIMGIYSITHLPGNVIAGYAVDKYGSKYLISLSLFIAGVLLLIQSTINNPWDLLIIRSISGFVLAFLSPACLAMLAKLARDQIHQGKLMTGNGLVHTLASVVSPAAGSFLVAKIGFTHAFSVLGWLLIVTSIVALTLKEVKVGAETSEPVRTMRDGHHAPILSADQHSVPWILFSIPLALSCSQGILFFELPFLHLDEQSIMGTGLLFTIVSLGSLVTLSMMFINRYSAFYRMIVGTLILALTFFVMAPSWSLPIVYPLFVIGMTKGIMYPAIATMFAGTTPPEKYGRVFSILSIFYSVGAFIGPMLAGYARDIVSPYFLAFLVLMIALIIVPLSSPRPMNHSTPPQFPAH